MSIQKHKSIVLALTLLAGTAFAQPAQPPVDIAPPAGHRMGPGMMGQGPGYRSAPGMQGGPAWGHGMRRGMPGGWQPDYPMGHGWGAGHGMGPGMMGHGWGAGHGMGPGMMGFGMTGPGIGRALWLQDLDENQRVQLFDLQEELQARHWETIGEARKEFARLRHAWQAPQRDRQAILASWQRLGELHLRAVEQSLDAADRMDSILSAQQREQLRRWSW